jgi:conjugative relaxase-like TrwC/TraI family protein
MIGFAKILGGMPSATSAMTAHLMNATLALGPEEARLAAYYGRGQLRDEEQAELARQIAGGSLTLQEAVDVWFERHPQSVRPMASLPPARSDLEHWAREVARGFADFADVLDMLVPAEMDRDQVSGFLEIEERVGTQLIEAITAAEREMLAEPQEAEERVARRLADMAERISEGLENAPVAVIRPDLHPIAAAGLGIDPDALLTKQRIDALLAGRRSDGELVEGKNYAVERQLPVNPKTGERKLAHPIGAFDFCPTPDKSVSVAWAFANQIEQARIFNAHIEASREAVATIAQHIGQARLGKGGEDGFEPGHVAWLEFTHHTARRVMVAIKDGEVAELKRDETAPGDPDLHTHFLIPNAVFCESGRVGSLDTAAIAGMIFKADAEYHARLGQKLRDAAFDIALDDKTGAARMTAIPRDVSTLFSKRSNVGEQWARLTAARDGIVWEDLTKEQQDFQIKRFTQDRVQQRSKGEKDDVTNFIAWKKQAKELGWEAPKSLELYGPPLPELTHEQRISRAYETALPFLGDQLERKSVLTHWDLQVAAARGLVDAGSRDVAGDLLAVTKKMRDDGVRQYGEQTSLIWGQEPGKRVVSVTTGLHESQEQAFIQLARAAAEDRSAALPAGLLRQKIEQSGLDFTGSHGAAQRRAIEHLGQGGRFGLAIAAAGAGKTTALKPLVAAWKEQGRGVYGASLAWRQADELTDAGIDRRNVKAFSVLLQAMQERRPDDPAPDFPPLKLDRNTVVAVDEWAMVGTRQALELLRLQERHGFSIVALGDDKQCTAISAGAIIDLSRRALGAEQVPEILTTRRKETERERRIAGLFRDGRAAEALDLKRADGTAEMAYGGYEGVVDRVAALYRERLEATGTAPTISAPTNSDAHRIGEAVRTQRRAMGLLGADLWSVRATDGERDFTLRLAAGDRVRLFKSTGAKYGQGRGGAIGRNGSVLEVVGADERGITLRTKQGRIGTVEWDALPTKRGRVQLAYGYAMTIPTAQGSTTSEHISALPSGSRSIDGLQSYSALTRHRQKAFLITSDAAEQTEVRKRRAINDARPITLDDKWAQVARVLSYQPEKDNAVSMFERVLAIRRGSVRAFHDVARRPSRSVGPDNALRQAHEHSLPDELRAMIRQAVAQVRHVAEQARTWRYEGPSLGR